MAESSGVGHLRDLRQSLLQRLLDAVKLCHQHFGGRKELAIDTDSRVASLLAQLEAIFYHGLKRPNDTLSTIRQVTEMVSNIRLDLFQPDLNFWSFLHNHLSDYEVERLMSLRNVTTDVGRSRAWLRASLNEKTLAKYVESMIGNEQLLEQYYESWAFLRDTDSGQSTMPQIAAGLSSILFALSIDSPSLNRGGQLEELSDALLDAKRAPQPIVNVAGTALKRERNKKPLVNIVSFDDSRRVSDSEGQLRTVVSVTKPPRQKSPWRTGSETVTSRLADLWSLNDKKMMSKSESFGSRSVHSPSSMDSDVFPELDIGRLQFSDGHSILPNNNNDKNIEEKSKLEANESLNDKSERQSIRTLSGGIESLVVANGENQLEMSAGSSGSESKMNSTAIHIVGSSDRVSSSSLLNGRLEAQLEEIQRLKDELHICRQQRRDDADRTDEKIADLTRQNELLKGQVKKYVEAVQMLKSESLSADPEGRDSVSAYEGKLIQVAEMHAELMEFNDRLQLDLNRKNLCISRLLSEVATIKGSLEAAELRDQMGIRDCDIFHPVDSSPADDANSLIHVWVPTAFLTGKGADIYHTYQIYCRVRDTEWNVYRRFKDFSDLHEWLKKKDPTVATFKFPVKKMIGHKDKTFVESRRKQLEEYLRQTLNHVVRHFPEFTSVPLKKETLISIIPFLSDLATGDNERLSSRRISRKSTH